MDELKEWIQEVLKGEDCRMVDLEWQTNANPPILTVSVERNDGTVDLDTCALCSDVIGAMLDAKDWFASEYMLEVCSPGAERELKTEEDIRHAVGQYVHCKLVNPKQGIDAVTGTLLDVSDNSLTIEYKDKTRTKVLEVERNNVRLLRKAVKI